MKKTIHFILNGLIPKLTENVSTAAQTVRDGASTLLAPGAGLINKSNGEISQNPQAFGFAFEHLQAIGFNINAGLKQSDARAYQIPVDGTKKYSPDIYVDKVGQVIAEIQAKTGSTDYVKTEVNSHHYSGNILTNSENFGVKGTQIIIDVDGIQSFPVSQEFAQWVAENPYLAANFMGAAATVGEVASGGIQGAVINASINILMQSIKALGAYCRNEQELAQAELYNLLQLSIDSLKSGWIRGVAIKVIQKLMKGNAFAALGFTVSAEVIPVLIQVMQDEITLEQGISKVGIKGLTSGMITTVVIVFPPVGMILLSGAVLQAIWEEVTPEWKQFVVKTAQVTVNATQKGIETGNQHLQKNPLDFIGSASASSVTSSAEMQALQNELDLLLE
jgi:hypothetical protein